MPRPTICLTMIVKDEAEVIERCLASVRSHIDCWVIADTGSTDKTPQLIETYLQDIPGELLHHPWQNFAANRSRVLKAARGRAEWNLYIDADEVFEPGENFFDELGDADAEVGTDARDERLDDAFFGGSGHGQFPYSIAGEGFVFGASFARK